MIYYCNIVMCLLYMYVSVCVCSALSAATGAHAIALMTEWDEFASLDYRAVYAVMAKPAFIFDGRNILNHKYLRTLGFEVYAIGKPEDMSLKSPHIRR